MCTQHTARLPLFVALRYHQRFWDVSTDLRLVTLAGHEFISGSSLAFSGSDVLHVPAVKMNEAKQEDVMEEGCDGEESGGSRLFHIS